MRPTPSGSGGARPATADAGTARPAPADSAATPGGTDVAAAPAADLDAIAARIQRAVEGLGTDEEAVYAALSEVGNDAARVHALRQAYLARTGRTLDADLADDLSGVELALANALIGGTREERVRTQMRRTSQGVWALGVIDGRGVTVDWEFSGTGSYHQSGVIYLNRRTPAKAAAVVMVHEAQHAETYLSGGSPDAATTDKETWVARMIADEAEAATKQFESALGLIAAGESADELDINPSLLTRFRDTYTAFVERLRADGAPEEEIPAEAHVQVRDLLVAGWFRDGTFRTSTSGAQALTYQQHYEAEWTRLQPPGGSGG